MYFAYCSNERLVLMSFKVRVREERMGCGTKLVLVTKEYAVMWELGDA